jgi:hypothetical protein
MAGCTHYTDDDYARTFADGTIEAVCGARITEDEASADPTCAACAAWAEENERQLHALMSQRPDPALLVKPSEFNATAGYVPRGQKRTR